MSRGAAVQWLARAVAAMPDRHPDDVHGLVGPVALALARAIIAPLSPVEMAAEATYVYDHVGLGEGHPMSCLARGAAAFMLGDEVEAARRLREGADTTLAPTDSPWPTASPTSRSSTSSTDGGRRRRPPPAGPRPSSVTPASSPSAVLVLAVNVLVETHAGRGDEVEADRQLCRRHLTGLVDVAPWLNLQARVVLARAAHIRGDRVEAEALLDEADAILETVPGAVGVEQQLGAIRRDRRGA